jgi:uncharacterized protein with HEPN domain
VKGDRLYLVHIRECIARIEEYTTDGKRAFLSDTRTQDAVLRNLQVMTESTQRLSDGRKAAHPEVDWRGMAGFRNVLTHGYLGVDPDKAWEVIESDLPALKQTIEAMLEECGDKDQRQGPGVVPENDSAFIQEAPQVVIHLICEAVEHV